YCVDEGPVELWLPGNPTPDQFTEAANNPDWLVTAFNDAFERLVEAHIMAPRHGWPLVPIERHRCLQAATLARALHDPIGLFCLQFARFGALQAPALESCQSVALPTYRLRPMSTCQVLRCASMR